MQEFECVVTDAMGLHARPAGSLVRQLSGCPCDVKICCKNNTADAKRLMQVMRLGAKCGETLHFSVEGEEEQTVAQALQDYCRSNI